MGHDGPGHVAISDERPVLRALKLFHGKAGAGLSVEFKVRLGPVTILGVSQTADGRLKLLAAEGESIPGPTFRIGNTNSRIRFAKGPAEFMDAWCAEGPTHHVALGVGQPARTDPQDRRPARARARGDRMSVRFLGPDTDAYVASVERHAAEFEEESGHRARGRDRPERPVLLEQDPSSARRRERGRRLHVGPGARLGASRRRIRAAARRVPRARGRRLRRRGLHRAPAALQPVERPLRRSARRGPLLEIPVNCESYNLAYVPAVLEEAGSRCRRPGSEYFTAARSVVAEHRRPRPRLRSARHRRVAHDVHRVCDSVLVVRRLRFRGRPLRDRLARVGPRNRRLHGGAARRRARPTGSTSAGTSSRSISHAAGTA